MNIPPNKYNNVRNFAHAQVYNAYGCRCSRGSLCENGKLKNTTMFSSTPERGKFSGS